jgi:hypothetical protein
VLSKIFLLAVAFQVGPFYEQKDDYRALRPVWSCEGETTDILWPIWTKHRDWWRFCYLVYDQRHADGGSQFAALPFWFNGTDKDNNYYWGLWPFYGRHPHIALLHDWEFAMWPVWMRYKMPRARSEERAETTWMTSNVVLFPFFSWRDDGSWGFWPFYGISHNRTSDHRYALWPFVNWAEYRADRDTSGAGDSLMVWPIYGYVKREREKQALFLPPFFSLTETYSPISAKRGNSSPHVRLRYPWPFIEWEKNDKRTRLSIFPLYEKIENRRYSDGEKSSEITRFGWRMIEILPNETRVFPFWAKNDDGYLRIWPFYERTAPKYGVSKTRVLSLFPIRWVSAVDRNWAKFWSFYEAQETPVDTRHSMLWGLIKWRTYND